MTPSATEARMRSLLDAAGLTGPRLTPLPVWEVFKRFASEPVECEDDYLLFQAGDSKIMRDTYLDFCREFRLRDGGDVVWYEQLHAEFTARRPHRLGFAAMERWSSDFASLACFLSVVERSPEFQAGLSFPAWSFRLYHTGV